MYVNNRACRPGVPLVDGVAVPIDLQRTIELRPGLDWAFAIILDLPAPENHLAFFIRGLQFQPHIESIHCAAGKEVPDLARAHYNIHARVIATPHRRIGAIDGSSDGTELAGGGPRQGDIKVLAPRPSCRAFQLSDLPAPRRA